MFLALDLCNDFSNCGCPFGARDSLLLGIAAIMAVHGVTIKGGLWTENTEP